MIHKKRGTNKMRNLFQCSIYTPKYFFTFEDIVATTSATQKPPFDIQWNRNIFNNLGISLIIPSVLFSNYDYNYSPIGNYTLRTYLVDLFQKLYGRFWKEYVFALDTEEHGSEYSDATKEFYTKMGNIIMQTYDRYSKLLDVYTSELSKLLDGVKTTTNGIGIFNDTPQNIQTTEDDFTGDNHISNASKSSAVAESDVDTKMARIDEIQRKLRNIWKDWLDEFDGLFLESVNL